MSPLRMFVGAAALAAALPWLGGCVSTESATESRPAPAQATVEPAPKVAEAPKVVARPAPKARVHAKPMARQAYSPQGGVRMPLLSTYPGRDQFPDKAPTGTILVADQPVSTFSSDVDTASYAFVRRYLTSGRMPPRDAVRVEEMVNYFPYAYPAPADRNRPFQVTTTVMPSPWAAGNQLLHIAVRGYDIPATQRPRANLVLLVDVSGSMSPADRLPLLQQAFRLFIEQLRPDDQVSIVTYANQVQVRLEPTPGSDKERIAGVIDGLRASGGTAGGAGLQLAYQMAERNFDRSAVNRVILATDGDFNVGITNPRDLEKFIAEKRKTGIYFSVFGVGTGNLNDALMQRLAQAGNGNAAYIDSLLEARKALGDDVSSTLFPIADDLKVQVEFNPARVEAYRLIGYETRALRREDFNDDKVDAGDIGAGHRVTAIYEISPAGASRPVVDPLRYQSGPAPSSIKHGSELAYVKIRYKLPGASRSELMEHPVSAGAAHKSIGDVPVDQRFAVAVAAFGQRLRGEPALSGYEYKEIASLAEASRGEDREGYRAEFSRLVRMAESLRTVGHGN